MRVSVIGYINSWPYQQALEDAGIEAVTGSPRECGALLASGSVEAALVPVRHAYVLGQLGAIGARLPFGIACTGATWSTLLVGPADLHDPTYATVTTDTDSSSAAGLSKVLLERAYNHREVTVRRGEFGAHPHLIIGDRALERWFGSNGVDCVDVCELWRRWTGLPFVFARWVTAPDVNAKDITALTAALSEAAGHATRDDLASALQGNAWEGLVPPDFVARYLSRLTYSLGANEQAGENAFLKICAEGSRSNNEKLPRYWWPRSKRSFGDEPANEDGSAMDLARAAIDENRRLPASALKSLLVEMPSAELYAHAHRARQRRTNAGQVTYVVDTNPNYSNICDANCSFCAFYVPPQLAHRGYERSVDDLIVSFKKAAAQGATTILLQGGHHPSLGLDYYVELVRRTRAELPRVTPHFWSAGEICKIAEVSGLSVHDVLEALYAAGQRSLPGGGAEILSDRVRTRISPLKISADAWIDVHRTAHQVGMKSTATMMYGHVEAPSDIVAHLCRIRALQDETGGFTAFIPWSFKGGATPLAAQLQIDATASVTSYLRIIAVARLALDNIDHIQASFFSEGWEAGELALFCGADDVGGVLLEENVHRAAGHINATSTAEVRKRIAGAGFQAVQRSTLYEPIAPMIAQGSSAQ